MGLPQAQEVLSEGKPGEGLYCRLIAGTKTSMMEQAGDLGEPEKGGYDQRKERAESE